MNPGQNKQSNRCQNYYYYCYDGNFSPAYNMLGWVDVLLRESLASLMVSTKVGKESTTHLSCQDKYVTSAINTVLIVLINS